MSGEPKTLTLEEALVLIARDTQYSLVAMPDEDSDEPVALSWVLLGAFDDFGPFTSWVQAAEYALGVRVVARDEAAELRAAIAEWVAADAAYSEWMVLPVREDWTSGEAKARKERLEAAEANLRRLAGGEEQE